MPQRASAAGAVPIAGERRPSGAEASPARPQEADILVARMFEEDLYQRLGVPPSVDAAALRRAFRKLALRFHPDRAGARATAKFQLIAAAYGVLSDPERRAAYDRRRTPRAAPPPRSAPAAPTWDVPQRLLARLCGRLSELVARGAAQVHQDGTIDLLLTSDELAQGGIAGVTIKLPVTCWVCGGLAKHHGFDCELCGFDGSLLEPVTVWVPLTPGRPQGHKVSLPFDRLAPTRQLTFCMRCP